MTQSQAECRALRDRVAGDEGARHQLTAERDLLLQERDELRSTVRRQVDEIEAAEKAAAQVAADAAEREAAREAARLKASAEGEPGPSWALVLADMERRWANTVGVPPGARAMKASEVAGQVAEALEREVERVREEVGVDVSLTITGDLSTPQPVVFLLAATDMLGAMVSTCERVSLEIEGGLVMVGEMWSELGDDIEVSRQRAVDAGLVVDPVEVADERVQVTLRS